MSHFDEHGDLWINMENVSHTPPNVQTINIFVPLPGYPGIPGTGTSQTKMNLTKYIRELNRASSG